MRGTIIAVLIFVFSFYYLAAQKRDTSNEQRRNIFEQELIKSNKIKILYKAKVKKQKDDFETGTLVLINHYDKEGRLEKQVSYEEYEDSSSTEFTYYPDGYLKTKTIKIASAAHVILQYSYDSLGKYTAIKSISTEYRDYEFIYDENRNLTKKLGYTLMPKIDDNGKVNEKDKVRTLVDEHNFKYDRNNNLIEESFKNKKQLFYVTKYKYNKNGNKIESYSVYLGNKVKNTFKYGEDNKPAEEIKQNIDGSKSFFKYSYEFYK